MSKEPSRRQFGLRMLLLWTVVVALYCGLAVEFEEQEWLVLGGWPALVLGLRFVFGSRIACHVSAIGVGAVFSLRVFFPALPTNAFEVQYAFVQGCGIGYVIWLIVELICLLMNRADNLLRTKPREPN